VEVAVEGAVEVEHVQDAVRVGAPERRGEDGELGGIVRPGDGACLHGAPSAA
jgi:hypothetical protein